MSSLSYNESELGPQEPFPDLVPNEDFGWESSSNLLHPFFLAKIRGVLGYPVNPSSILETIFLSFKESVHALAFETPEEFLKLFEQEIRRVTKDLAESFIPEVALKASTYLQVIHLSAGDTPSFREIFDHFRELITTYHEQLFPEVRTRSGEVHFVPWSEFIRLNIITKEGVINPKIFGKEIDPTKQTALVVGNGHVYKGGFARMLAKAFLVKQLEEVGIPVPEALANSMKVEYPPADVDAILKETTPQLLEQLKIEQKDTERNAIFWNKDGTLKENELLKKALRTYFDRRDLQNNATILFPGMGLYVTQEALQLYMNGGLQLEMLGYDAFGMYSYFRDDKEYLCPKALFRMLHPVLGGYQKENGRLVRGSKSHHVDFKRNQICPNDLGIFWMALLRKSIHKLDAVERMVQLHSMAVQMGATREKDPCQWWAALTKEYQHFKLDQKEPGDKELLVWFATKVVSYVQRLLRKDFSLPKTRKGPEGKHLDALTPNDAEVINYLAKPTNKEKMQQLVEKLRQ